MNHMGILAYKCYTSPSLKNNSREFKMKDGIYKIICLLSSVISVIFMETSMGF